MFDAPKKRWVAKIANETTISRGKNNKIPKFTKYVPTKCNLKIWSWKNVYWFGTISSVTMFENTKDLEMTRKFHNFLFLVELWKFLMSLFIGHSNFRTFCCSGQQQLTILTSKYKTRVKRLEACMYIYLVCS